MFLAYFPGFTFKGEEEMGGMGWCGVCVCVGGGRRPKAQVTFLCRACRGTPC